eukprot:357719-Chlamydomonas_euryale.AAC.6
MQVLCSPQLRVVVLECTATRQRVQPLTLPPMHRPQLVVGRCPPSRQCHRLLGSLLFVRPPPRRPRVRRRVTSCEAGVARRQVAVEPSRDGLLFEELLHADDPESALPLQHVHVKEVLVLCGHALPADALAAVLVEQLRLRGQHQRPAQRMCDHRNVLVHHEHVEHAGTVPIKRDVLVLHAARLWGNWADVLQVGVHLSPVDHLGVHPAAVAEQQAKRLQRRGAVQR